MNEDCPYCKIVKDESVKKIYEDDKVIAVSEKNPVCKGHVIVMPKEHFPILELVPNNIVSHLFTITNKIATAVFDSLGVHGTNILVNNGIAAGQEVAHFMVNIIPRTQGDGLDFAWIPKQLGEEEMSPIELGYKENMANVGVFEEESNNTLSSESDTITEIETNEDNYMLKQLNRIP